MTLKHYQVSKRVLKKVLNSPLRFCKIISKFNSSRFQVPSYRFYIISTEDYNWQSGTIYILLIGLCK